MHLVNFLRISAGKVTKSIPYSYTKSLRIVRSTFHLHCQALSGWLLLIGLAFASVNAVSAQGCDIVFDFQEFDPGFINLYPGLDQPPPEFTSGGIVMDFSPYSATPGGDGSMEAASFVESPGGIDSPMALLLTATNARFDMTAANLPTGVSITGISIQLKGDGSGAPINLGVNGNFPFVGPGPQIPTTLPDGIVAEIIPGSNAFIATVILTGDITGLEIGGNIALSNLCVFGSDPSGGDTPGCMNASACNYNPNATVEDGSCNFDESHTFTMTVDFDQHPAETSWLLMDAQSDIVLASTPYTNGTDDFSTLVVSTSLCPGCYTLTVADEFGDGMCCGQGEGGFELDLRTPDAHKTAALFGPSTSPVPAAACALLWAWLAEAGLVAAAKPYVFVLGRGRGAAVDHAKPLDARRWTEAVKAVLKRQAGVPLAPKDLRSSFITFLLSDANSDEALKKAVATAMRHSTAMQTSGAYDKDRAERTWASAVQVAGAYAARFE